MTRLFNSHKPNHLVLWKGASFNSDSRADNFNDALAQSDAKDLDAEVVAQIKSEAYKQGWLEAELAFAQKKEDEAATMRLAVALEKLFCDIDEAVKNEILELSLSLARIILNREIEGDVDFYARLVDAYGDQSLERSPVIRLNPEDLSRIVVHEGGNKRVSFQSDSTVPQGSCFLDTSDSILDLSTDVLLTDLMQVFTDQLDANDFD